MLKIIEKRSKRKDKLYEQFEQKSRQINENAPRGHEDHEVRFLMDEYSIANRL
jgi:hypothetical protein